MEASGEWMKSDMGDGDVMWTPEVSYNVETYHEVIQYEIN